MERSLTNEEVDKLQFKLRDKMPEKFGVGRDYQQKENFKYSRLRVHKVLRIENRHLWVEYQTHISVLAQQIEDIEPLSRQPLTEPLNAGLNLKTQLNEVLLFHGTKPATLSFITKGGFDPSFGSMTGLFGAGNYFAENISKSDQYVTSKSEEVGETRYVPYAGYNAYGMHGGTQMDTNESAKKRGIKTLEEAKADCMSDNACVGFVFGVAPSSRWPKINKNNDGTIVAAYYWKLSAVEPRKFRQQREYTTYVKTDSVQLCPVFVSRVAMGNTVGTFRRPVVPTGTGRLMHKFCIIGPDNLFRQAQSVANQWHKSHKGPAHSVLGHGISGPVDGLEFVVYKQKQCYPEYLVFFERMPDEEVSSLDRSRVTSDRSASSFISLSMDDVEDEEQKDDDS